MPELGYDYINRRADFGASGKVSFADVAKGNYAVFKCKKGVIVAKAYVFTRHHGSAALADNYLAGLNNLSGKEFNAKVFWLGCI